MDETEIDRAHKHSLRNRREILASEWCGCCCCLAVFPPAEITWWIDGEQTAMCPHCLIDAVIGSASGYQLTAEFLTRMKSHWFGN